MNLYKYIVAGLSAVLLLSSCSFMHDDQAVARVGKTVLYKSQLDKVIPSGLSKADSAAMAANYIKTWATRLIINEMAEAQLSKEERDISREMEDFKSSLLKFRYEQHYIADRLDTAVTMDEIRNYYKKDSAAFTLSVPVTKAVFLRIPQASTKVVARLKGLMTSEEEDDIYLLDSLAHISADKYTRYDDKWVDFVTLARDFGMEYGTLIAEVRDGCIEITDEDGMAYIACLRSYIPAGKIPPVEYCADRIREIIVSRRKYALSSNLEKDLLDNALEKGNFEIY